MKKYALTLFLFSALSAAFYFFYLKYEIDYQTLRQEKEQLAAANDILSDKINEIQYFVDSLGEVTAERQPPDLAALSQQLQESVYKIIVWQKKETSIHDQEHSGQTEQSDEYEIQVGTAFCVFEDDILLTNHHVIGENALFAILLDHQDRQVSVTKVLLMDKNLDYAVLRAPGLNGRPLMPTDKAIDQGVPIMTMGNPLELDFTPSLGWISALRLGNNVMQISNPITYGNSGGPVVDHDGQLLGLVYGGFENNAMLNFAVNIHAIMHDIEVKSGLQLVGDIAVPAPLRQSVYSVMGPANVLSPEAVSLHRDFIPLDKGLQQINYGRLSGHSTENN